jgi:hypothetical protein
MFSSEKVQWRNDSLLDTLCARLETLMKYKPGERDLVMLQHKFVVKWKDGTQVFPCSFRNLCNPHLNFATGHSHVHVGTLWQLRG